VESSPELLTVWWQLFELLTVWWQLFEGLYVARAVAHIEELCPAQSTSAGSPVAVPSFELQLQKLASFYDQVQYAMTVFDATHNGGTPVARVLGVLVVVSELAAVGELAAVSELAALSELAIGTSLGFHGATERSAGISRSGDCSD
jgi:hypothetical protein